MKKVLLIGALAVVVLASCKKKECECVTKQDGVVVQTLTYEENDCASLESTQTINGMTQSITCSEK